MCINLCVYAHDTSSNKRLTCSVYVHDTSNNKRLTCSGKIDKVCLVFLIEVLSKLHIIHYMGVKTKSY